MPIYPKFVINFTLFVTLMTGGLIACEKPITKGYLQVNSLNQGSYEIYKYEQDDTTSLVSEHSGSFNVKTALSPGSYLILADCSSEVVIIYPDQLETLVAHSVKFMAPLVAVEGDSFSLQCSRSNNIRFRQQFSNRYEFNILHGVRDLLVSLVPFRIDFESLENSDSPRKVSYQLSAVRVDKFADSKDPISYFVSPENELVSVTKSLPLGNWEFLLPGVYSLELNGTKLTINVEKGEIKVIRPSSIAVLTSFKNDQPNATDIKGAPQLVEMNSGHWLNFNETYPILPGKSVVQIKGSARKFEFVIEEGDSKVFRTKSVTIKQGCSPWEWTCLGQRDVMLYEDGQSYPFVENTTDIPVLYIDEGAAIWVGVGGSRDIRYKLPAKQKSKTLNVGYVNLVPTPVFRAGQRTDLLRVETENLPFDGVSLDLNLEKPTKTPLIAGWYFLSHYVSISASEGERRRSKRGFRIKAGETIDLKYSVFFSEKHLKAYSLKHLKKFEKHQKRKTTIHPLSTRHRAL
jgi:hypothetical protein